MKVWGSFWPTARDKGEEGFHHWWKFTTGKRLRNPLVLRWINTAIRGLTTPVTSWWLGEQLLRLKLHKENLLFQNRAFPTWDGCVTEPPNAWTQPFIPRKRSRDWGIIDMKTITITNYTNLVFVISHQPVADARQWNLLIQSQPIIRLDLLIVSLN